MASWKERAIPVTAEASEAAPKKGSWKDRASVVEETDSLLESGARGLAQGASFGFADEITGGLEALYDVATTDKELSDLGDLYEQRRDESRANYKKSEEDNPLTYGAGQIGGAVGTAFVPGLGGASLGKLAAQGAVHASGASEADNVGDLARDAATGAGMGLALGAGGKLLSKGASALGKAGKEVLEDVATAPITSATRAVDGAMGKTAKTISTAGKYGDKFDKGFDKLASKFGFNEQTSNLARKALGGSGFAGNPIGKAVAAADAASNLPNIAQKGAMISMDTIEMLAPKLGKYGPVLMDAAQRGGNSLAASHFVLQQSDEGYRQKLREAQETEDER